MEIERQTQIPGMGCGDRYLKTKTMCPLKGMHRCEGLQESVNAVGIHGLIPFSIRGILGVRAP